jgi:hypothetical protein
MERSAEIGNLVAALAKAQGDFTPAIKATTNTYFNSKYADLAANIDAVRPALNKHGIALMQFPDVDLESQTVRVTTALHHGEQFISQSFEAPAVGAKGFNVQSIGACTTYLRRYGLQALVGLASEDDDGNSVATENAPISKAAAGAAGPRTRTATGTDKAVTQTPEEWERRYKLWAEAFMECATIDEWNRLIVPMMKERADHPEYGRQFIIAAAEEAKRRAYVGDRATGNYKASAKTPPMYANGVKDDGEVTA